ncbi:MAG: tetratricopeptide repeat protein [Clostridiales bacterium]|nr:tetratricopeptide repeat protein [Clostridiales bacterium]
MGKKIGLFLIMMMALVTLTACGNYEATYNDAQRLLSQSEYEKAAEKFAILGSYEDASLLAMYCRACALCEEGKYQEGIDALEILGDYKDCEFRISYYTARSWDDGSVSTTKYEWMQRAQEIYRQNPLYLDSLDRIAKLDTSIQMAKESLYEAAVRDGESGRYSEARSTFDRLGDYKDSREYYQYYGIREEEATAIAEADQDGVLDVASRYSRIKFLDCADRAALLKVKADEIVANKYAEAAALIDEGKCEEAEKIVAVFGKYGNEQVPATYYAIGEKYLKKEEWGAAIAAYQKSEKYGDAENRIRYCFMRTEESSLENDNADEVIALAARFRVMAYVNTEEGIVGIAEQHRILDIAQQQNDMESYLDCAKCADALRAKADEIVESKYAEIVVLVSEGKCAEAEKVIATFGKYGSERVAENYYAIGRAYINQGQWDEAVTAYKKAGKYSDAVNCICYCWIRKAEDALGKTEDVDAIMTVAAQYADLNECMDSVTRAEMLTSRATAILDARYEAALEQMNAGEYDAAIEGFNAIIGHRDSGVKIEECRTAILDGKYEAALEQMNAGEYDAAIEGFTAIIDHRDSGAKIEECRTAILDGKYEAAQERMNAGDYLGAYKTFMSLDEYRDSAEKAFLCYALYVPIKMDGAKKGGYVTFGSYEQDNKVENGKEDIEWLILDIRDEKMLLISKYALDCKPYHENDTDITWENSDLRKWLNGEFVDNAFTDVERAWICISSIPASNNSTYRTNAGKGTQDQVFLLNISQVKKYFKSNDARKCQPTAYAVAEGATVTSSANCHWWLRTPGSDQSRASSITSIGIVDDVGRNITNDDYAVRPVLWIDLSIDAH